MKPLARSPSILSNRGRGRPREDTSSYGHYRIENGQPWYAENLFVVCLAAFPGCLLSFVFRAFRAIRIIPTSHLNLYCLLVSACPTSSSALSFTVTQLVGANCSFTITAKVNNTGSFQGSDVVQVYRSPSSTTEHSRHFKTSARRGTLLQDSANLLNSSWVSVLSAISVPVEKR